MDRAELADEIVRYIEAYIDSVPEIEALILLRADGARVWSAEEIAARIYVSATEAQALCANLERKKLLLAEAGGYRFPADEAGGDLFARVAAAYRSNLVAVAHLIHSKSSPALREFARAFRFKE